MRNHGWALAFGATLLLGAGTPAAQARNGGSLLGPGGHGGSSGTHTPPPGSAERKALMDALRLRVGQASGKYVVFAIQHLKVSGGWAWAVVRPQSASGRTTYDRIAALLHKSGGQWAVAHIQEGRSVTTDPNTLRDKYPDAPPSIF